MVVAGAAAGAALGLQQVTAPRTAVFCVVPAAAAALVRRVPPLALASLALFGFGCGALSGGMRAQDSAAAASLATVVPHCDVSGRVVEPLGGLGTLISLDEARCEPGGRAHLANSPVVADLDLPSGTPFRGAGWLIPLGGEGFDLARRRAGAGAALELQEFTPGEPDGAFAGAAAIRSALDGASRHLARDNASLLRGVTIGDTEDIPQATLEEFRRSGLSHLLAVSGSNVAIVLAGVMWLMRSASFRARIFVCALALAMFVLVVGPDGSVVRAAGMGAVALVALAGGRRAEPLHALGVATAVLVVVRPHIVFSVGFHLSLAATAGIVLWAPRLAARSNRVPSVIRFPLAVTLAAQAGVLPLLAWFFGQVSLIAPIANLVAAPAVPPATVLGLAGGVVALVHEPAGALLMRAAEPFAWWILRTADAAASPGWVAVEVTRSVALGLAAAVIVTAALTLRRYGTPINLPP